MLSVGSNALPKLLSHLYQHMRKLLLSVDQEVVNKLKAELFEAVDGFLLESVLLELDAHDKVIGKHRQLIASGA